VNAFISGAVNCIIDCNYGVNLMKESYFQFQDKFYYLIHSKLKAFCPTLLFIHGIGDASVNYNDFIQSELVNDYNILVPDLLGYGKSSAADDYSFQNQVSGMQQHMQHLESQYEIKLDPIILIAHSMGAIHATLLCESQMAKNIKGFINVEGSITQYGSFVADKVKEAEINNNFLSMFNDFKNTIYLTSGKKFQSLRRYYAALLFCRPEAFKQNALEMRELSLALPGKFSHIIGKKYAELKLPRVYCYGNSMCKETLDFLSEKNLKSQHFNSPNHFLMAECFGEFVVFIKKFIQIHCAALD
jgi:pimeloyl-ACP methyl ester carboxylesterase